MLPKAPQYIIFETHVSYAGDSGSLAELSPVNRMITGSLDSAELLIDDDGGFEILVAPERPAGTSATFVPPSRKVTEMATGTAGYVIVRMLFHDWENEQSPELGIVAVGREGAHPEPIDTATAAASMRPGRRDRRGPDEVLERLL